MIDNTGGGPSFGTIAAMPGTANLLLSATASAGLTLVRQHRDRAWE